MTFHLSDHFNETDEVFENQLKGTINEYHDEFWDGWIENGGNTLCIYPNGSDDFGMVDQGEEMKNTDPDEPLGRVCCKCGNRDLKARPFGKSPDAKWLCDECFIRNLNTCPYCGVPDEPGFRHEH